MCIRDRPEADESRPPEQAVSSGGPAAQILPDVYKRQDHVLRLGGNTDRQRERVVAAFEKQKTTAEIAEILKTLYHGGNGLGSVSAWLSLIHI